MSQPICAPRSRGRHAPPVEVRIARQPARLLSAAAQGFARLGYAEASAEAVSHQAGMSKATFYEHFANKEECILALFDVAAEIVLEAIEVASRQLRYGIRENPRDLEPVIERVYAGVLAHEQLAT